MNNPAVTAKQLRSSERSTLRTNSAASLGNANSWLNTSVTMT